MESALNIRFLFTKDYWKNAFMCRPGISFFLLLILALLMYPASLILPVEVGYENSWIENAQLAVLLLSMAVCFSGKSCRSRYFPMFLFVMLIFFSLAVRETNTGKTLFYPDPVRPNRFLSWDEIWYTPYLLPARILFAAGLAAFFFCKKIYLQMLDTMRFVKLPLFSLLILAGTAVAGSIIDKATKNLVLEEGVELVFYLALFQITLYYVCQLSNLAANPQD